MNLRLRSGRCAVVQRDAPDSYALYSALQPPYHFGSLAIRRKLRSKAGFPRQFALAVRAVQQWEQGRTTPDRPCQDTAARHRNRPWAS